MGISTEHSGLSMTRTHYTERVPLSNDQIQKVCIYIIWYMVTHMEYMIYLKKCIYDENFGNFSKSRLLYGIW
jgi:hypothetical protein